MLLAEQNECNERDFTDAAEACGSSLYHSNALTAYLIELAARPASPWPSSLSRPYQVALGSPGQGPPTIMPGAEVMLTHAWPVLVEAVACDWNTAGTQAHTRAHARTHLFSPDCRSELDDSLRLVAEGFTTHLTHPEPHQRP